MPRKKKSDQPIGVGLTAKQMKRKKPINADMMRDIEPLTQNQKTLFESYNSNKNLVAYGCAGTGKTFITLYNALQDVLDPSSPYEKIYIVRSLVATREIGFLPGDHEDKSSLYQIPYKHMVKYMFELHTEADFQMLYGNLKTQGTIDFWSTSFIRGTTLDKAIIIVDEFQNLNYHELDSIMTRVGESSKIMFCGDATQTDLLKQNERNGIHDFMRVLRIMPSVDIVEFGVEDIVRSGLVKEYILAKLELNFMTFSHCNFLGDLELEKKETPGCRLYHLPDGQWVPSITSVTSFYNRQIFIDWRKRVGIEEANRITKKATARGTDFHEAAQAYLENKELNWDDYRPATKFMFHHATPYLDKINNIHAIERTLYSEYLGLAGRVDCIAEYEGELAVIDFKTSEKIKPEKWLENYFVQETFYAAAYYELTGIPVKKLITLMVTPAGEVKVFDKRNKGDYIKLLVRYIKEFVSNNTGTDDAKE